MATHLEYYIILLILVCFVHAKNNVCKNWSDYFFGNKDKNKNCMFNSDMYLNVPQLLEKYYGEYEVHEIPTSDGYFVTTYRIPRNNSKGTLVLIHPASTDAATWIAFGKGSVAHYFWREGFEIWLPNRRGTENSRRHVNLTINDLAFWDFGFHETGLYDMRASLKYIHEKKNNTRIAVLAHSMASAEMLVYNSLFPEEAHNLSKIYILLAPTYTYKYSSLRYIGRLGPILKIYSNVRQAGSFTDKYGSTGRLTRFICPKIPSVCNIIYSLTIVGVSKNEENPLLMPQFFRIYPQAISVKSVIHYFQLFASGKFRMYDYGDKNANIYGSHEPPEYPIYKILAPIYLVHSPADKLASSSEVYAN